MWTCSAIFHYSFAFIDDIMFWGVSTYLFGQVNTISLCLLIMESLTCCDVGFIHAVVIYGSGISGTPKVVILVKRQFHK